DQGVRLRELVSACALELGVRDDVDLLVGVDEPAEPPSLVVLEVRRRAAVEEGPAEPCAWLTCTRVPGVGAPVAVVVAMVVGLPRLRRHDDGDAVDAQVLRPEDEGRVADPAAGGVELDEVDAARPVAETNVHDPRAGDA